VLKWLSELVSNLAESRQEADALPEGFAWLDL
jgi:hypothetical protein